MLQPPDVLQGLFQSVMVFWFLVLTLNVEREWCIRDLHLGFSITQIAAIYVGIKQSVDSFSLATEW